MFLITKKQEFGRFNKVFPFFKYTKWRPFSKNYRLFVGGIEILCGSILLFGNTIY
jgi:hypothetical protein